MNRQEQTPAQPVIQLNPFFAHPDQLLLAMCSDDDDISIRLLAICYHSEKTARLMNTRSKITKSWNQQHSCDSVDSESEE